jgi:hypothetical protein
MNKSRRHRFGNAFRQPCPSAFLLKGFIRVRIPGIPGSAKRFR